MAEGVEAARFFATYLDFGTLTEMAKAFVAGEDTNPDNDPNLMPTRFMILYGADDSKLQHIDDHPDCLDDEKHKNNVANLRKSLIGAEYDVATTGSYDDEVYIAHVQYMASRMSGISGEALGELQDDENPRQPIKGTKSFSIKLKIKPNDPERQDDSIILYSTDRDKSYQQIKTVKDDADPTNDTLDLVYTELREDLSYTLEVDLGSTGQKEYYFRNRPYGKWFD